MGISTKDFASLCRNLGLDPMAALSRMETPADKRSKYGVDQSPEGRAARTLDGHMFDSKAEMRDYQALKIAEQVGAISQLELQPRFLLQSKFTDQQGRKHRASYYISDFSFLRDGKRIAADRKGHRTAAYREKIKRAILLYPDVVFEEWSK